MSAAAYSLPKPAFLKHASDDKVLTLQDGETGASHHREFTPDDALAASGDCFVTIATRLDKLSLDLEKDSKEQIEVEHIIRSLLYLQDHYAVIAKHKLKRR